MHESEAFKKTAQFRNIRDTAFEKLSDASAVFWTICPKGNGDKMLRPQHTSSHAALVGEIDFSLFGLGECLCIEIVGNGNKLHGPSADDDTFALMRL